jgi:hypothetical protein
LGKFHHKRITAAFSIGYLISFLRNKLFDEEAEKKNYRRLISSSVNCRIISTIQELYQDVFNESILAAYIIDSEIDLKITLENIFEMISEKIQRGGESFLEISFYCGGFLSLSESDYSLQADSKKYETIIYFLLSSLNPNFSLKEIQVLISDLTSSEAQSRIDSRNQLFFLICQNQVHLEHISEIQNLVETIYHNTEAASA